MSSDYEISVLSIVFSITVNMVRLGTQQSSVGEFESRFAHLVKPIRDLTKNWNMNIASELADYLEEVRKFLE